MSGSLLVGVHPHAMSFRRGSTQATQTSATRISGTGHRHHDHQPSAIVNHHPPPSSSIVTHLLLVAVVAVGEVSPRRKVKPHDAVVRLEEGRVHGEVRGAPRVRLDVDLIGGNRQKRERGCLRRSTPFTTFDGRLAELFRNPTSINSRMNTGDTSRSVAAVLLPVAEHDGTDKTVGTSPCRTP